jgi:hypothetical protein
MSFERVYTMTEYYDGPRGGIASFRGEPHVYTSVDPHGGDLYELRAIDEDTLRLALEDWEIWLRWEDAFEAGHTTIETHPALPNERARHDAIQVVLDGRFAVSPGPIIRARGEFRPMPGHADAGRGRWMEAKWTVVES